MGAEEGGRSYAPGEDMFRYASGMDADDERLSKRWECSSSQCGLKRNVEEMRDA